MAKIEKNSSVPIYMQLSNIIREKIKNGEFKYGTQLPSENELSLRYSISRMTTRAALLQVEKEGLISKTPGKGRFVGEANRHKVFPSAYSSAFTIAVYPIQKLSNQAHFYSAGLLNGLTEGFLYHHIRGKFFQQEEIKNSSLLSFLSRERIDGLIWVSPKKEDLPQIKELKEKGLPVVTVNQMFPGSSIGYVSCDHYQGAYQLVEYLINLGHKKIVCVNIDKDLDYAVQRRKGYFDAHYRNGLSVTPELTIEVEKANLEKEISKKLDVLRKKEGWPTAIFIAGGGLIPPTLRYLSKKGIKFPEDISLAAFDEIPLPLDLPKLTCVRQPLEKMGEMATEILIRNLQGKKLHPAEVIMEPTFVLGGSCRACFKRKGG